MLPVVTRLRWAGVFAATLFGLAFTPFCAVAVPSPASTPTKRFLSPAEVRQQFKEPGHIPQSKTLHPLYPKLNRIVSPARQKHIDDKKKAKTHPQPSPQKQNSLMEWFFPSAYAFGKHPTPAPSVVPLPVVTATPGPGSIDLRSCDTPIKTQFTSRCTAFSTTAAMENMACNLVSLSPDHLWSFYAVYSIDSAVPASLNPITTAAEWPVNGDPLVGFQAFAKTHTVSYTDLDDSYTDAILALQRGSRVVWAGTVPQDMAAGRATIRSTSGATTGGHAIEVAGYQDEPFVAGGGYLILKNSWGTENGDLGYQYYPVGLCDHPGFYCVFYSIDSITIDP
jgi:hypothetical protein